MNISSYVFGRFSNGYSQYPDDYTNAIFTQFASLANAPTQIAVHRDGDLMYYAYIRRLDEDDKYIGICSVINGSMLSDFDGLFNMYEQFLASLIASGQFVHFSENGGVTSDVGNLHKNKGDVDFLIGSLRMCFDAFQCNPLPPVAYAEGANSVKTFVVSDPVQDIITATVRFGYVIVHKASGYDTRQIVSYKGILRRVSKERDQYRQTSDDYHRQLIKAKAAQRNMKWVAIMGFIILVLGVVLWNKVLFPSEVTHYETGEFIYYGPLQNNKPHGTGVAIYPADDKDGRKFYIGNFVNGERQDSAALLYYRDGDYFYGRMKGDKWEEGIIYLNSDNSHFTGTFKDNSPYTGSWFDHRLHHHIKNGK